LTKLKHYDIMGLYIRETRRVTRLEGDPQNVCEAKLWGEESAAGPVGD
jgi:hypothetical protein